MKISNESFVSIEYTLKLNSGEVADQSDPDKPLGFVWGRGHIIPALEKAIEGLSEGESVSIDVKAIDGYGEKSPELIQELPKAHFPDGVEIKQGMVFQSPTPHGTLRFIVAEVKEDTILADLNHPMAGEDLHFDVKIVGVREATEEELSVPEHVHGECDGQHTCHSCKA